MMSYRSSGSSIVFRERLTALVYLSLVFLEVYSVFMLLHINSWYGVMKYNASIIEENQGLLLELDIPKEFDGNLLSLVEDDELLYVIPSGTYTRNGSSSISINGNVYDTVVLYAFIDGEFAITDGESIFYSRIATYWDISLGKGVLEVLPDIFCMYLMFPFCLLYTFRVFRRSDYSTKCERFIRGAVLGIGTVMGIALFCFSLMLRFC